MVRAPVLSTTLNSIVQSTIKPLKTLIPEDSLVPVRAELFEPDNSVYIGPDSNPRLFKLGPMLGAGAYGKVFSCYANGEKFAVKKQVVDEEGFSPTLLREIGLMKSMKCAFVAR